MDSVRTNTDRLAPPTTEDNLMSQVSDVGAGGAGGTMAMPPPPPSNGRYSVPPPPHKHTHNQ